MIFNINERVRVQLTPHGRAYHAAKHALFNMKHGQTLKYFPPQEDASGWSTWQLWSLMNEFGSELHPGNATSPFHTNIDIMGGEPKKVS